MWTMSFYNCYFYTVIRKKCRFGKTPPFNQFGGRCVVPSRPPSKDVGQVKSNPRLTLLTQTGPIRYETETEKFPHSVFNYIMSVELPYK